MPKFRKKPVVIEAVQWTGTNVDDISYFMGKNISLTGIVGRRLEIITLEGIITASPTDWIIKGVLGEFYPCKPDIFELTYELVEE